MSRYINVDKLGRNKFQYVTHERYVSDGKPKTEEEIYAYKVGYNEAIDNIIQFTQTADVVEVVRCKDCKYWDTSWKTRTEFHYYCPMIDGVPDGYFFCADGERRGRR